MPNKEQPKNPHDSLFKATFTNREAVIAYIKNFLPEKLSSKIDVQRLTLQPGSYMSPKLKAYYSDIVYDCYLKKGPIKISLLFEHKSTPPKRPHLQLLRYMLEAWEVMAQNNEPLIPIVPIILYHGKEKWKSKPFYSYFGEFEPLLDPYLPSFEYELTDLADWPDDIIWARQMGILSNAISALKHSGDQAYVKKYLHLLLGTLEKAIEDYSVRNFAISLFVYLISTSGVEAPEMEELVRNLPRKINQLGMTTLEQFIQIGEQRGKELGETQKENYVISQGLQKGIDLEILAALVGLSIEELQVRIEELNREK